MVEAKKGKEYLLDTSQTKHDSSVLFRVVFCHKDDGGHFIHGVTSEEILKMMIARYVALVEKDSSTENVRALLHLRQAYQAISDRNFSKVKRKARNDSSGNDISVQAAGSKGRY